MQVCRPPFRTLADEGIKQLLRIPIAHQGIQIQQGLFDFSLLIVIQGLHEAAIRLRHQFAG